MKPLKRYTVLEYLQHQKILRRTNKTKGCVNMQKVTLQQQRDLYVEMFGEESRWPEPVQSENDLQETEEAIAECYAMLESLINRSAHKEEIAYWRKLLQENKMHKRSVLAS